VWSNRHQRLFPSLFAVLVCLVSSYLVSVMSCFCFPLVFALVSFPLCPWLFLVLPLPLSPSLPRFRSVSFLCPDSFVFVFDSSSFCFRFRCLAT
jgi:hypothetical protein